MTEPVDPPVDHPDELLAGYVDGSASAAERRAVDGHLESCESCRQDVQMAAMASTALASLPELGAPGLASAGVAALRRAALHPLPEVAPPVEPAPVPAQRAPARFRLAWSQLAAAAAIIVVVGALVAIPLALSGGKANRLSTGAADRPAPLASSAVLPLIDQGHDYSHEALNTLASRLAATREGGTNALAGSSKPTTPAPAAAPGKAALDSAAAGAALQCVIDGGAPPQNAQPIYLEQAEVSGTPAYVGGFFIPDARLNVMVVAVSRDGCNFLYSVSQPG
jgi:hypothetical protein